MKFSIKNFPLKIFIFLSLWLCSFSIYDYAASTNSALAATDQVTLKEIENNVTSRAKTLTSNYTPVSRSVSLIRSYFLRVKLHNKNVNLVNMTEGLDLCSSMVSSEDGAFETSLNLGTVRINNRLETKVCWWWFGRRCKSWNRSVSTDLKDFRLNALFDIDVDAEDSSDGVEVTVKESFCDFESLNIVGLPSRWNRFFNRIQNYAKAVLSDMSSNIFEGTILKQLTSGVKELVASIVTDELIAKYIGATAYSDTSQTLVQQKTLLSNVFDILCHDKDRDGYGEYLDYGVDISYLRKTSDYDDINADINPSMPDETVDGIDQNCDGIDGYSFDSYGGWVGIEREATGFFRTEKVDGRWWFITPEGHPYFLASSSSFSGVENADSLLREQYLEHNFNAIPSWSTKDSTYTEELFPDLPYAYVFDSSELQRTTVNVVRDYFDPEWETEVEEALIPILEENSDNKRLVGFYYGNELHWTPDHKRQFHAFDDYMSFEAGSYGKTFLIDFVRDYYNDDLVAFNEAWGESLESFEDLHDLTWIGPESFYGDSTADGGANDFDMGVLIQGTVDGFIKTLWDGSALPTKEQIELKRQFAAVLADKFYGKLHSLIREYCPNHLILGDRQVCIASSKAVSEVVAKYSDVYSIQPYLMNFIGTFISHSFVMLTSGGYTDDLLSRGFGTDQVSDLMNLSFLKEKPIIISEFGITGHDTDHKNTTVFPVALNQTERANAVELVYDLFLQSNQIIGLEYYKWVDQPVGGRGSDGEDTQCGLVSSETGEFYQSFANRMKELNTWWVVRAKESAQEGPSTLVAAVTANGLSTGSLYKMPQKPIRTSLSFLAWTTQAYFSQSSSQMYTTNTIIESMLDGIIPEGTSFIEWFSDNLGL